MKSQGVSEDKVRWMQQNRVTALVQYLLQTRLVGLSPDSAYVRLCETQTFRYLMMVHLDFWWKSVAELTFLLNKELDGDLEAWHHQAFGV